MQGSTWYGLKEKMYSLQPFMRTNNFLESKELVSTMHGHSSAIHQMSVHGSGRHVITTSQDTSILWDLDTFTRKRTLNGAQAVGVQEVSRNCKDEMCAWVIPRNFQFCICKLWWNCCPLYYKSLQILKCVKILDRT